MDIPTVRPPIKAAAFLACLVTLAAAYFSNTFANTSLPFLFLSRMKDLALATLVVWSAGGWGIRLMQRIRVPNAFLNPLEHILWATTLGLGCLSFLMILLGVVHAWVPAGAWALVLSGLLLSGPFLKILRDLVATNHSLGSLMLVPVFAIGTGGILSLLLALAPITYYDSLVYHLALPAAYLRAHHWVGLPGLIYSAFPQTLEMLWSLALLIGNDVVVNLVGWSLSVLLVLAVVSYARRFFDRNVGWVAAALIAMMPAFLLLGSGGYIDVGLTLFCFMSIYTVCLWNEEPSSAWLLIAGLFSGWAVGTKYTGALVPFLLTIYIMAKLWRREGPMRWSALGVFAGGALIAFGPWAIKNTCFVGNPVFPFFHEFGIKTLNPWVNDAAAGYFAGITEYFSRPIWTLPAVLWETAVNGIQFGRGIDVLGDFGWLPLISLLPALGLCRKRSYYVYFLLIFSFSFFGLWALSRPVLRFLLPISPLWALLAAYAWVHGVRSLQPTARWLTRGVLGTFLLSGLFLFFYTTHVTSPFEVAIGLESRDAYLSRMLDYYPAAVYINTQTPETSRVYIMGDQRGYYYQRDILISPVFSRNPMTEWANAAAHPDALKQKLKDEGVTHIVVNRIEFERLKNAYPTLRFTAQGQKNWDGLNAHKLTPLYHDRACDVYAL